MAAAVNVTTMTTLSEFIGVFVLKKKNKVQHWKLWGLTIYFSRGLVKHSSTLYINMGTVMGMLEQALHNWQWNADCHFESDKVKDEKPSSFNLS